jgi:hypothetical protein
MVRIRQTTLLSGGYFITAVLAFNLGLRGVALALDLVRRHVLGANEAKTSV